MDTIYSRARDIFIENLGSPDLMVDNNCLDEYKHYNVPREMEYIWKDEFIKLQFGKANSQNIRVSDLVCSVCLIAGYYGNHLDYQKIFSIKKSYLNGSDIFEYIMYFDKVLDSLGIMLRNNTMTKESMLEIVCEFENMITEFINEKGNIPDKIYDRITQKYCFEKREDYTGTRINKICSDVKGIKECLLNFA